MRAIPKGRVAALNDYHPGPQAKELVDVAPFWIDENLVTVADYRACVEAGAC